MKFIYFFLFFLGGFWGKGTFFFFPPVLTGTWHQDFLFYLQILTVFLELDFFGWRREGRYFSLQWSSTSCPLFHRPACEGFGLLLLPTSPQAEIFGGSPLCKEGSGKKCIQREVWSRGKTLGGSPDHGFISRSFAPCGFRRQGGGLKLRTSGFKTWCCPKISMDIRKILWCSQEGRLSVWRSLHRPHLEAVSLSIPLPILGIILPKLQHLKCLSGSHPKSWKTQ